MRSHIIDITGEDHAVSLVFVDLGVLDRDRAIEAQDPNTKSLIVHRRRIVQRNRAVVLNLIETQSCEQGGLIRTRRIGGLCFRHL